MTKRAELRSELYNQACNDSTLPKEQAMSTRSQQTFQIFPQLATQFQQLSLLTDSSPVSSSSNRKVRPSSPVWRWPERTFTPDTRHHRKSAKMIPNALATGTKMSGTKSGSKASDDHSIVATFQVSMLREFSGMCFGAEASQCAFAP